jgi:hypothetical protein
MAGIIPKSGESPPDVAAIPAAGKLEEAFGVRVTLSRPARALRTGSPKRHNKYLAAPGVRMLETIECI